MLGGGMEEEVVADSGVHVSLWKHVAGSSAARESRGQLLRAVPAVSSAIVLDFCDLEKFDILPEEPGRADPFRPAVSASLVPAANTSPPLKSSSISGELGDDEADEAVNIPAVASSPSWRIQLPEDQVVNIPDQVREYIIGRPISPRFFEADEESLESPRRRGDDLPDRWRPPSPRTVEEMDGSHAHTVTSITWRWIDGNLCKILQSTTTVTPLDNVTPTQMIQLAQMDTRMQDRGGEL